MTTEAVVEGSGAQAAGEQLSKARQAAGLSLDQAATKLRVPLHVVAALEQGHWERLGAPVFIRGQLRSYARLLQLDPAPLMTQVPAEQQTPVALVSHGPGPGMRRYAGGLGRKLAYVALAAVLVVPGAMLLRAWLQPQAEVTSLDTLPAEVAVDDARLALPVPVADAVPAASTGAEGAVTAAPSPVVASPAPSPAGEPAATAAAVAGGAQLLLVFAGDSWIEIAGPQGQVVEKSLVQAGQQRSYPATTIGRVLLGNSTQVQASIDGRAIDLATMGRSNVARFTVSSDGSVSPLSN